MSDPEDENSREFKPVDFEKERDRVFSDLAVRPVLVTAWVGKERPIFCHVVEIRDRVIKLQIVAGDPRGASAGVPTELMFSLDEGQFHLITKMVQAEGERWHVAQDGQLLKLQRRNNFRATIPFGAKIAFKMTSHKTKAAPKTEVALIDLSAGGARLRWPTARGPIQIDDSLTGLVSTPGREVEVFGVVKTIVAEEGGFQVGVQFHNVSQRDEQALLFLCLQMRRLSEPVKT